MGRDAVEPYPMRQTRVVYEQRLVMEPIVAPQPQRSKYTHTNFRLRVVSNFGDSDRGAGKIHTRAREIPGRRDVTGARKLRGN